MGPAAPVEGPTFPFLERAVPRLLGTEHLGHVLVHRPSLDPTYVSFSSHLRLALTHLIVAPRLGLPVNRDALNSVTRGLVGDTSFAILPEITKEQTFLLTFVFQLVCCPRKS